eukprot:TRINITY_DN2865_c0_g1_i1.p1 TRINITY_DN2865_c0_g1~~TRINITY_DN2865_c0_g1_i1.p1  ORF type:complete len:224 (+),score=56.73 TRINITY_DN2865_c0_g1_i1:41-712(+)
MTSHKSPFVLEQATAYTLQHSSPEDPFLYQIRVETQETKPSKAGMVSTPEQQKLIQILLKAINAKKTLDIGTFTGYSALSVAQALPEDGEVFAFDVDEDHTALARKHWKLAGMDHKIHLTLKPAVESLNELITAGKAETFDYAFIDADKPNYENYYELALRLLRKGGLLVIDNVLWKGRVYDESNVEEDTVVIRRLNQRVKSDPRVLVSMITIADGITICYKL